MKATCRIYPVGMLGQLAGLDGFGFHVSGKMIFPSSLTQLVLCSESFRAGVAFLSVTLMYLLAGWVQSALL